MLTIQDDGIGFDPEKVSAKKTFGIVGMRERTTMMGGSYNMRSMPGKGTTIIVNVPLTAKYISGKE